MIRKGQSMMNIPTFWRALWYLVLLATLTLATVLYTLTWSRGTALKDYGVGLGTNIWGKPSKHENTTVIVGVGDTLPPDMYPIEHLMNVATKQFNKVTNNQIHTLDQAAAQYRKLRGRHPPPDFDEWYTYATSHNAIINEKFWDQIYHDLAPFWSLDPVVLRKQAHVFSPKLSIHDGKVEAKSYNQDGKMAMWQDMFTTLANDPHVKLPDIDIPLNINDSPAMLVPWETIDTALSLSRKIMPEPSECINTYSGLEDIENLTTNYDWKPEWLGPRLTHPSSHLGPRPLWSLVRPACPPSSPARAGKVFNDIWDPEGGTKEEHGATALLPQDLPKGSFKGYMSGNWTKAIDACEALNLQGLHSAFVAPKEMGIATQLFPLFGDSKFGTSNEILLPGAADWNSSSLSTSVTAPSWEEREDKLFWRGSATAALSPERYWQRFQTERLVSMLNATHVEIAEASIHSGNESTVGVGYAKNFRLLPANEYHLKSLTSAQLAEWVNSWADVAFTDLQCEEEGGCAYLAENFQETSVATAEEEGKAKYAISIDSCNSSLSNLLHNSKVTLRSSIYRQWYDSRLVPWVHFIPMDNTFVDIYGIMEYFLGTRIPEGTPDFAHAVGEVQKHEHHFHTPEGMIARPSDTNDTASDHASSSQSGNEPHIPHHPPSKRSLHDDEARGVAHAGKEWADKVLRKEDMLIYVYRLLLEYARVVDDKRERLGWTGDLR